MKKGDSITVIIAGRELTGVIELISGNGRSIAIFFDEGVPIPYLVHPSGKQCVFILREDDGTYTDIFGEQPVLIKK